MKRDVRWLARRSVEPMKIADIQSSTGSHPNHLIRPRDIAGTEPVPDVRCNANRLLSALFSGIRLGLL